MNDLTEDKIRAALTGTILGRDLIEIHDVIDSTNKRAGELALAGAAEGSLVIAETQTAGKGRLGRVWHSPAGKNIYVSIILRPNLDPNRVSLLTLAAGLSGSNAIAKQLGIRPAVKWPNDLLIDGKKICGILSELEMKQARVSHVIIGVGINVNMDEDDFPPEISGLGTSLKIAVGQKLDRAKILSGFLDELEKNYFELSRGNTDGMLDQYRRVCLTLGQTVSFQKKDLLIEGIAEDIDRTGELLVKDHSTGRTHRVTAGDVNLLKKG